jgi:hypothetical protein
LLIIVCRATAFRITEDADLDEIHICGHHDVDVVAQWLKDN